MSDDSLRQVRDVLADYAHGAWSGWMKYLFEKSKMNDDGTVTMPKWAVDRWLRQSQTSYDDLPEPEKNSDLQEADKMIELLQSSGWTIVSLEWDNWVSEGCTHGDCDECPLNSKLKGRNDD